MNNNNTTLTNGNEDQRQALDNRIEQHKWELVQEETKRWYLPRLGAMSQSKGILSRRGQSQQRLVKRGQG
jgi:hypothetical protein